MKKAAILVGWAAVTGLLAGVLLDAVTFLVARYGPQADGWSFRGNGALAVPFGLGPAVLAGCWAAVVFHYRGFTRWRELGVAFGLVGTGFLLISVLVLVLFNDAGMVVSSAMSFFILAWLFVAPVLAGFIPTPAKRDGPGELPGHLGAGAILAVVLVVAFSAAALVLAPGS